jgi:DNA-binding NarL/FixJ family response regulator
VAPATRQATKVASLTDREHDVLRLMARGATNAEIAATMHVAKATVKTHVGSIFAKLGVATEQRRSCSPTTMVWSHPASTPL